MTIYHNPACSKSRAALALLTEKGVAPAVRLYLEEPPTVEELERVLALLGMEPRALLRTGEAAYTEQGLADPALTRAQLVAAMVAHPSLIERPIVLNHDRAVVGRPPERVLELL